jgi:hypothetical protein
MIVAAIKNLLILCGILDATISAIYLLMYGNGPADGPLTVSSWTIVFLNRFALAAGVCTIAAGIRRPAKGMSWLLVLNGLAFSAYGLIPLLSSGPLSFRPFALLIVVMAMSFGVLAWPGARTIWHQRHGAEEWLFVLAGATSVGFALAFLSLANGWIQLERRPFHPSLFLWLCLFFGFSAICMLGLAVHVHSQGPSQPGPLEVLSPLGNPKPAH